MRFHRACALTAVVVGAAAQPVVGQLVGQNFSGSTRTLTGGSVPSHSNGAIGTDHFVEFVKGRWATYRKSDGALVSSASGTSRTFWSNAGVNVPVADAISYPRVAYDHASRRWFASSIDVVGGVTTNSNNILLAVSNSSDPTAGWKGFKIDPNSSFADFATLGFDANGVYLAANNYAATSANGFQNSVAIVSIPKQDLLLPTPIVTNRTVFPAESAITRGWALQPSVNMGPSAGSAIFLGPDYEFFGILDRTNALNAAGPGAATLLDTDYIEVPDDEWSTSTFPLGRQPNGTRNLETFVDSMSVVTVGNTIWAVNGVEAVGAAAIRWHKIDAQTNTVLGTGIIGDAAHDLSFPSIAANSNGDVVIGFTRSGPAAGEFASSYAAVGTTTNGVTTFGAPLQLKAGLANYQVLSGTQNRWGAYSNTTPDPTDPQIFWTIQAYAAAATEWQTQMSEIIVPKANEFRWKNAANGTFSTAGNWFSGVSPVGNANARVIFSRPTDPSGSGYTATFGSSYSNDSLSVRQGKVTFSLGGNYQLTNTSTSVPGVIVGEFAGNTKLILTGGGQLTSVAAAIAPASAATAAVEMNNASWSSTHSIVVGGNQAVAGGIGSLTVGPASTVTTPELKAWSTGTISLTGGTLSAGLVRLSGGQLTSNVTTSLTSPVTSQAGTLQVDSGTLTLASSLTIAAGSTLSKSGAGTLTIAGPQSHGANATLTTSAGITNINTDAAGLSINANSSTNFGASQQLTALTVGSSATATLLDATPKRAIKANTLTITGGKLDLKQNMLITQTAVGTATGGTYNGVQGMVQSARNGGGWNGSGLTTSVTEAMSGRTTIGVATGAQILGLGGSATGTFAGQTVTGTSTIAMYTFGGDANLSGNVDADDYFQIDSNYNKNGQSGFAVGYFKGDFDYNGIIDGEDYFLIDSGFSAQFSPTASIAVTAVPEPASCIGLMGLALHLCRPRRGRKNSRHTTNMW